MCIVQNYWDGFLKEVELELETDIHLFPSSMQRPEWSESVRGDT